MIVKAQQTGKTRHNNSTLYEFHILVDDVAVLMSLDEGDELFESPPPKKFLIQIQDGCDAAVALQSYLQKYKESLSDTSQPADLPAVEA